MNTSFLSTVAASALLTSIVIPQTFGTSISSLVSETLRRNPEIEYYRAAIDAAEGERRTAGEWTNPEVNTELGSKIVRDNGTTAGPLWSLAFSQPFEFTRRIALRKAIASHQIALAKLALEDFELELANRVRLLAYKTIVARRKAAAAERVAQRFRELISVLEQREPAGVGPLLEARLIEANASTLR